MVEEAARSLLRRGDPGTAVMMLCRAADLSPAATERSRRLAEAAYIGAEAMGEVESIAALLERGRQVSRTVSASLHYASAAALVMLGGDTPIDAVHRLLVGAIESGDHRYDPNDPELINALWTLALVCCFSGRGELWAPLHTSMARLSPAPPPLLSLTIDMFADPARTGVAALPRWTSCTTRSISPTYRTSRAPPCTPTYWPRSVNRCGERSAKDGSAVPAGATSWLSWIFVWTTSTGAPGTRQPTLPPRDWSSPANVDRATSRRFARPTSPPCPAAGSPRGGRFGDRRCQRRGSRTL